MNRSSLLLPLTLLAALSTAQPLLAADQPVTPALTLPIQGHLPSLDGATDWLNGTPLSSADLRGKVVLVNFWTYSCINSIRQIPYVRAWAQKYKDQGLVVIGVHAPEFGFEQNVDNVRRAIGPLGVDYPVAIDNEHAVWQAFDNRYWPALYFIDAEGRIRHDKFGEGDYAESERVIQQLLTEAGAKNVSHDLASVDARGPEADADWDNLRSPETYVGYERTERFSSPGDVKPDRTQTYAAPSQLALNHWALAGDWAMGTQATVLHKAGGRVVYRFHARDVHLVMGPATAGKPVRFRVTLDGQPPGEGHGVDVDGQGNGVVNEPRMYQLIRQAGAVGDRQFEIEFLDPAVEIFAFTFG
ncbi:thioredoxin family protein [Pseudomonas sp. NPDC090202]|uniref:thioredoxin family protein n=1 Tax=unclassified Pseudomonas TaxID=196821 RepID=UPI0037F7508C